MGNWKFNITIATTFFWVCLGSTSIAQEFNQERLLEIAAEKTRQKTINQNAFPSLPIFYQSANLQAASAVGNAALWQGNVAGYNVTGAGITIGYWDLNSPRLTHQEFDHRVTFQDNQAGSANHHATQMVGTMVSKGVDAQAKGMAFEASVRAWNWNNDRAEMAQEAANFLTLSDHPYANTAGWTESNSYCGEGWTWYSLPSINAVKAYQFGYYDAQAKHWDELAYLAPNYLIVKAAGNFRGTGPESQPTKHWFIDDEFNCRLDSTSVRNINGGLNGFETLTSASVSKNVLVVGAVTSTINNFEDVPSIVPASGSGFGPTDDGRIKPDIVAPTHLYTPTASSNTSYGTGGGTSASSAVVAGSVALIRDFYQSNYSDTLSSASLRALLVHTANDVGNVGPDYSTGWGLLNTERAVRFLASILSSKSETHLIDTTLAELELIEIPVIFESNASYKITIAWTDPEADQLISGDDPTNSILINDVDVEVISPSAETFEPWVLDPVHPEQLASQGVNSRDNIEQIIIEDAQKGTYTVRLSHKDTLRTGAQRVSVMVSRTEPIMLAETISDGNWYEAETWENGFIPTGLFSEALLKHEIQLDSGLTVNGIYFDNQEALLRLNGQSLVVLETVETGASKGFIGDSLAEFTLQGWSDSSDSLKFKPEFKQLKKLTVSANSDTVRLSDTLNIFGSVILDEGYLKVENASLTLLSDTNFTAGLFKNSGKLIGEMTYERTINSLTSGWRMLSSPFSENSFSELNSQFYTQGGPWASHQVEEPNSVLWWFTPENQQYDGYYGEDATFVPGKGVLFYAYEHYPNGSSVAPTQLRFSGTEQDSLTVPLWRGLSDSLSYSLLGNPFAASIDWHAIVDASVNLSASYAVWNPAETSGGGNSGFKYYHREAEVGSAGRYIAPLQAFLVQSLAEHAEARFTQGAKAQVTSPWYGKKKQQAQAWPFVNLQLRDANSQLLDKEAHLIFAEENSDQAKRFDVMRVDPLTVFEQSVSFMPSDKEKLVFHGISDESERHEIPLQISVQEAGEFFLFGEFSDQISQHWAVYIVDTYTEREFDIEEFSAVPISMESTNSRRYQLKVVLKQQVANEENTSPYGFILQQNYPNPFNPSTIISFQLENTEMVKIEVFNAVGRKVETLLNEVMNAGSHHVLFDGKGLSSGVYFYRMEATNKIETRSMVLIK